MLLRALVAAWVGIAVAAQSVPAKADPAEVEALLAKGNDLRRANKPGAALPYFQKAYELARTPRTTGQLGLAELAANYPVEAAEHLASALETPNDPSIFKFRQMLADALTMARSRIGELVVIGSPAGAEVVVNGRVVGALPLSSTIKLAASNTEVVVRAPGYSERRESIRIASGQRHELTMNLEKLAKSAAPAPAVIPAPSPPPAPVAPGAAPVAALVQDHPAEGDASMSPLRTAAWLFGGAALVAGGAGLALHLAARANAAEFNTSCANPPTGVAAMDDGPLTIQQCQDRFDAWQSYRRWSIVGYASGAALAVTSSVLLWTSRPRSSAMDARAQLRCGPTPNGIACQGVF